jgi:hypothetical protein
MHPLSRRRGTDDAGGSRGEAPWLSGRDGACGVLDTLAVADEAVAGGDGPALLPIVQLRSAAV